MPEDDDKEKLTKLLNELEPILLNHFSKSGLDIIFSLNVCINEGIGTSITNVSPEGYRHFLDFCHRQNIRALEIIAGSN